MGGAGLLALALGLAIAASDGLGTDLGSAASTALGAIAALAVIVAGPVACLAAIVFLTASNLDPAIGEFGGLHVTGADVFWAGLAGWWLLRLIDRSVRGIRDPRPPVAFGQGVAIAFLAYAGLALWWIGLSDPAVQSAGLVPYLRVVHTAVLAWLAASMLETRRDVRLVLGALVLGGAIAIAKGLLDGGDLLSGRTGAGLGANELGLVAGVLLLSGIFSRWSPRLRYPLVAGGVVGLLLAKSVASFVAVGVAVALGAALAGGARRGTATYGAARAALALGLAGILVFTAVQIFRPEQAPGSEEFGRGSAAQRIVVGAVGLEIFERHPITGVGWGRSGSPAVIGDREVVLEARRRFPDVRSGLFPDRQPTTVHNTYIQILAELGLIGFALFVALVLTVGYRAVALLRRLGRDHALYPEALVISLALLLVLVWRNEIPLFGGQPETVIPVVLIGVLAAIARITMPSTAATTGGPPRPAGPAAR